MKNSAWFALAIALVTCTACAPAEPTLAQVAENEARQGNPCEHLQPGWQCGPISTPATQAPPLPDPFAKAEADIERRRVEQNREIEKEQSDAKRAAIRKAAAEARHDRALDGYGGSNCAARTFSRFDYDVRGSLGLLQTAEFDSQRCSVQHKILALLGQVRKDERAETFDRLLDAAQR